MDLLKAWYRRLAWAVVNRRSRRRNRFIDHGGRATKVDQ